MSWRIEHGEDYKVPDAVDNLVTLGHLVDTSWHNDESPSFMTPEEYDRSKDGSEERYRRLWVLHPESDEPSVGRFMVQGAMTDDVDKYGNVHESNDIDAALRALFAPNPVPEPPKELLEAITRGKAEILADVNAGKIPRDVRTFAELHEYVDANAYGGLMERPVDVEFANRVQKALHSWIRTKEIFVMVKSKEATDPVVGATIKKIRPMTKAELDEQGWDTGRHGTPVAIVLSTGTILFASRDEEGNGPGAMFGKLPDGTFFGY